MSYFQAADYELKKEVRRGSRRKLSTLDSSVHSKLSQILESHEIPIPGRDASPSSPSELSFIRDMQSPTGYERSYLRDTSLNTSNTQSQSFLSTNQGGFGRNSSFAKPGRSMRQSLKVITRFEDSNLLSSAKMPVKPTLKTPGKVEHVSTALKTPGKFEHATATLKTPGKFENINTASMVRFPKIANDDNEGFSSLNSIARKSPSMHTLTSILAGSKILSRNNSQIEIMDEMKEDVIVEEELLQKEYNNSSKLLEDLDLDAEEIKLVDGFIIEVLGIQFRRGGTVNKKGRGLEKRKQYMKDFIVGIEDPNRRRVIMTLLRFKKKIKKMIKYLQVVAVVEELTDILFITMEINSLHLFMETLHLIADTYAMFGDFENSMFAFNQLRLASELSNNLDMKIYALTGMGDIAKRLFKMDIATMFIRRALQYAWYVKDISKELLLYDRLGIIHYHIGDMERANFYHERSMNTLGCTDDNLLQLSRLEVEQYIEGNHSNHKQIATAFFSKLSLPSKKSTSYFKTKLKKSIPQYVSPIRRESMWNDDGVDSPLPDISKQLDYEINANILGVKEIARFSTTFPLENQIQTLIEEPEFARVVPSPRSVKENGASSIPLLNPKYHRKEDTIIKRTLANINEHTLKKNNQYSLKAIFGEDPPYKDYNLKIENRLARDDHKVDFWDIKQTLLTEYKTNALNGRNAFDCNTTRFSAFIKDSIDYLLTFKFKPEQKNFAHRRPQPN